MVQREGVLFCLVGPAGSGKTSVGDELLRAPGDLRLSVSVTSRPPRPGEIEGQSYFFVSQEEFDRKVQAGEFFEWEEIHKNFYGTLRSSISDSIAQGIDLLLRIDINGAINVKRSFPRNTCIVFLSPPSKAILKERLRGRGAISEEEFLLRLHTAEQEYVRLLDDDAREAVEYLVINNAFDQTVLELQAILTAERCRLDRVSSASLKALCAIKD